MKEPDVATLLKTEGSPFYHPQLSKDASSFLKLTGCMPRDTLRIIDGIDPKLSLPNTRKALNGWKNKLLGEKLDIIEKKWWRLALKSETGTVSLLATLQSVIQGYERFDPASKNLYDYGLVYLEPETETLKPASELAMIALQYFFSRKFQQQVVPVSVVLQKDGASSAGSNFQQQIEQCILGVTPPFNVKATLCKDASVIKSLRMDAIVCEIFDANDLSVVKIHPTMRKLWIPKDKSEDFDFILTPSGEEKESRPLIADPSITDPFSLSGDSSRVEKMKKLAKIMDKLEGYWGIKGDVLMLWNGRRENATKSQPKTLLTFPDNAYLVDSTEVSKLGVKL
jgi:hypothetical protein